MISGYWSSGPSSLLKITAHPCAVSTRLAILLSCATALLLSGCASVFDDGALAVLPCKIAEDGRIVVSATVNGTGQYEFVLDTGASISVMFEKLRKDLDLDTLANKVAIVRGEVASGRFPLVLVEELQLDQEVWRNAMMVTLPDRTSVGAGADGILGTDILRRYAVGFSSRERLIRLYPHDRFARESYRGWESIPLQPENFGETGAQVFFLLLTVDGQILPAIFDLGAGLNLLNKAAADEFVLLAARRSKAKTLSGIIETTPIIARYLADEVTTSGVGWLGEEFTVADLEIFKTIMKTDAPAAIVGAGLFTQRDFVIDFARNRLLVKVSMDEVEIGPGAATAPIGPAE